MAITSSTIYTVLSGSGNDENGEGFDPSLVTSSSVPTCSMSSTPSVVNMPATYTTATTNSDAGNYLYVSAQTNWTAGWYYISSNTTTTWTVVGTPAAVSTTGGYVAVDYSQSGSPHATATSATSASTTVTCIAPSGGVFTPVMVGNLIGTSVNNTSKYAITAYTSATVITVDRAPAITTKDVYVGGSGATIQNLLAAGATMLPAGCTIFCSGSESRATAMTAPPSAMNFVGFTTTRGDGGQYSITSSTSIATAIWNISNACNLSNIEFNGGTITGSAVGWLTTSNINICLSNITFIGISVTSSSTYAYCFLTSGCNINGMYFVSNILTGTADSTNNSTALIGLTGSTVINHLEVGTNSWSNGGVALAFINIGTSSVRLSINHGLFYGNGGAASGGANSAGVYGINNNAAGSIQLDHITVYDNIYAYEGQAFIYPNNLAASNASVNVSNSIFYNTQNSGNLAWIFGNDNAQYTQYLNVWVYQIQFGWNVNSSNQQSLYYLQGKNGDPTSINYLTANPFVSSTNLALSPTAAQFQSLWRVGFVYGSGNSIDYTTMGGVGYRQVPWSMIM